MGLLHIQDKRGLERWGSTFIQLVTVAVPYFIFALKELIRLCVPSGLYSTNPYPNSRSDWFLPRVLELLISVMFALVSGTTSTSSNAVLVSMSKLILGDGGPIWHVVKAWVLEPLCKVVIELRFAVNFPFWCFSLIPLVKQPLAKCPFLSHLQYTESFACHYPLYTCAASMATFTSWCICRFTYIWNCFCLWPLVFILFL